MYQVQRKQRRTNNILIYTAAATYATQFYDSIRSFIHTKQSNTQTQSEQPKQRHQLEFQ